MKYLILMKFLQRKFTYNVTISRKGMFFTPFSYFLLLNKRWGDVYLMQTPHILETHLRGALIRAVVSSPLRVVSKNSSFIFFLSF